MADNYTERFKKHLDKIQAGTAAFTPSELKAFFKEVSRDLSLLGAKPQDAYAHWSTVDAILVSVLNNGLGRSFTAYLEVGDFYRLGRLLEKQAANQPSFVHNYLDILRQPSFLSKIKDEKRWTDLIHDLIQGSRFTVYRLFQQRLRDYPDKVFFRVLEGKAQQEYRFKEVGRQVERYARGLAGLLQSFDWNKPLVAFLLENSLAMAELDLACLTSGLVNVMIPANSVPRQIEYILNQSQVPLILVANDKQLAKVKSIKSKLPHLQRAVLLEGSSIEDWILTLDELVETGNDFDRSQLNTIRENLTAERLASVMYTSGTTGEPKGIMFSQMNIVFKRFCRAIALPQVGDEDRFLSYLPLYHTFGRWLEMMGSLFWAAEYTFMENPALPTMLNNMQRIRPTIFISIPKKWIQLYEYIGKEINIEIEEDRAIQEIVERVTGGALRRGLSAAGYLDPDVFTFFQRYNVQLLSGFGMTEATGGITMTEPKRYVPNSLGKPLPGIEVKLGSDGEMLIQGSYVMMGYYGWSETESPFVDGWFPTGDIMRQDEHGYFEIIDRKKEIYKNIKGETIAPQRVENLFRDFEYIQQVFLVGDHRPFNTLLIYPDYENSDGKLEKMADAEKQEYFSSVVVTVNKFLAPFERIVDFRLIRRPFSAEEGELTPKGTFKRRIIERNFSGIIETMYTKNYISLFQDDLEIRVPNWFLREIGCLITDLQVDKNGLHLAKYHKTLRIVKEHREDTLVRIGDYVYQNEKPYIDFQTFLANPFYWLGNQGLTNFTGENIFQWYRIDKQDAHITFRKRVRTPLLSKKEHTHFQRVIEGKEYSLFGLNDAVLHLQSDSEDQGLNAVNYLQDVLANDHLPIFPLAREIIQHPEFSDLLSVRRRMFQVGLTHFKGRKLVHFMEKYLDREPQLLDEQLIGIIAEACKTEDDLNAVYSILKNRVGSVSTQTRIKATPIPSLLNLLAVFGIKHPTKYKRVRQLIVRYQLREDWRSLSIAASQAREKLLKGFREWLGSNQQVSVDVETGEEYEWKDVIIFEEIIKEEDRRQLLGALTRAAVLREAVFLFSEGNMVRLSDIPPGGIWISVLEDEVRKAVFRVSVQTRYQGAYDFVLNMNRKPIDRQVTSEMNWLIHAGAPAKGLRLIEDFGGFWPEYNIWTEDFYPGDTVARFFRRSLRSKSKDVPSRLFHIWPFFVRTAMTAHVNFCRRTGYRLELKNMSPENIVLPHHDYQTGMRLVSIARRQPSEGLGPLLQRFYRQFILSTEDKYPLLKQDCLQPMFSGVLDSEGEERGVQLLQKVLDREWHNQTSDLSKALKQFIKNIKEKGFIPKALHFAIQRFHRWYELSHDPALSAQAQMLNELYDTYQLYALEKNYPETRTLFYLDTVFVNSHSSLRRALRQLSLKQHREHLNYDQVLKEISELQAAFKLSEHESFFLSRLGYPHLKPTDSALLVSTQSMADVIVQLEDAEGVPYQVRKPISPKEISRLHQLFLDVNLPVQFRPEHSFLIAVSERGFVIGGLFYRTMDDKSVYMEKIVVASHLRRKGISDGLMNEFFNRLRDHHVRYVTTGFFRPEYFYRFGFKIERKYAGLAKDLNQ